MRVILSVLAILLCISIYGQEGERCLNTIQNHKEKLENEPEYKQRFEEWQKKTAPIINERREQKNPGCTSGPLRIPVAVHFDSGIIQPSEEACAITIAIDQIEELNREMIGQDSDAGLMSNFTSCFGAGILGNACIEFCIADQDHPSGYGLSNGDLAITFGDVNFNITGANYTPVNSEWAGYVNIYVDNLGGGLLGVSNGIPGGFNGDGVMVTSCVFGTGDIICNGVQTTGTSGCFTTYDEGETLAHEIGHYFGLFHIWGDNSVCNGTQDTIADTPNMSNSYSGFLGCGNHNACSDLPQTCGDEDMYMNFMSYAGDGCMYMFTSDQSDVMYATAITEGYATTSPKCSSGPVVVADFSPQGNISICTNDCISYTDLSTNSPTSWSWVFTVTSGNLTIDLNSSNLQNPTVCHTGGTSGTISTELTVTNGSGTDMVTYTQEVTVISNTYYRDADMDNFGDPNDSITACTQPSGYVTDNTDCDDTDDNTYPGAPEICDNKDNDCDGAVDEDGPNTYYADTDSDTYGDLNNKITGCTIPAGYVTDSSDCNDMDDTVYPGAMELCDGQINDCDLRQLPADEADIDGDRYVVCTINSSVWNGNPNILGGGDCDDSNSNIHPGVPEVCDGIDNNCDGNIDEGVGDTYFADTDGDGFGDPNNSIMACTIPSGYVIDDTDCDDTDATINPNATESCDGIDNNCDGVIDEGFNLQTFYADTDSDGYGDSNNSLSACTMPTGYVTDDMDCDDTDPNINPNATEVCDGVDNNCDGNIDEGLTQTYFADIDGDGFGDANDSVSACAAPSGYVADDTDCDDTDGNNYPGNTEVCDGTDNNCDGNIDEGIGQVYYADSDGDGYGDSNNLISACVAPSGYVTDATDCDDTDGNNYPGNTEGCDGTDNNCDGIIDEGCGPAPDCDGDYLVINTISQNTYRAEINIISDTIINTGQSILFTAGIDIDLVYPFEVVIGTEFEARIEPCTPVNVQQGGGILKRLQGEIDQLLGEHFSRSDLITVVIEDQKGHSIWEINDVRNLDAKVLIDHIDKAGTGVYELSLFTREKTIYQKIAYIK